MELFFFQLLSPPSVLAYLRTRRSRMNNESIVREFWVVAVWTTTTTTTRLAHLVPHCATTTGATALCARVDLLTTHRRRGAFAYNVPSTFASHCHLHAQRALCCYPCRRRCGWSIDSECYCTHRRSPVCSDIARARARARAQRVCVCAKNINANSPGDRAQPSITNQPKGLG